MTEHIVDSYSLSSEYEDEYECEWDDSYTPSSCYDDYSPSHPWDAPGMSISDFIDCPVHY